MIRLFLDTSYKYLTCILFDNEKILSSYSEVCFKHQSELVFPALEEIFAKAGVSRTSVKEIYLTEGPGSYTGVRIAMTIAKTMGELLPADVYVISTLQFYAAGKKDVRVLMNARADRAYTAVYDRNIVVEDDSVLPLNEIELDHEELIGDLSLFGKEDVYPDMNEALLATLPYFRKVDNIAHLVPKYLKESESYLV